MDKSKQGEFAKLIDEVRLLFHRLASIADQLHESDGIPASQRAVLELLSRKGARTVPQMASLRSVSRQHIQIIVNALLEKGLVTQKRNPTHKRSSLIDLTEQGHLLFHRIKQREQELLAGIDLPVSESSIKQAGQTLQALNGYFDGRGWDN